METLSAWGVPLVLYKVETLPLLSETQNGEPEDSPTPHGFCRFGSMLSGVCTMPLRSGSGFLLPTRSVMSTVGPTPSESFSSTAPAVV